MRQYNSFKQAYQQVPWRTQIRIIGLLFLVLLIISLIASIYLSITAEVTRYGRDIQDMQGTISVLEMENAAAQADLSELQSLEVMVERAGNLGFKLGNIEEKEFIVVEGYVPPESSFYTERKPPILAEASVLPDEYTETIFEWLERNLAKYQLFIRK